VSFSILTIANVAKKQYHVNYAVVKFTIYRDNLLPPEKSNFFLAFVIG